MCMMCADPSETAFAIEPNFASPRPVRALIAFLQPVISLQTQQERFEKYQEIWSKLNPNQKTVWVPHLGVNYPWDSSKIDFWKTLRREIQTRFRAVICDECSREFTTRPIQDFSFMHYSEMLLWLLDKYLAGLNDYIAIQDDIDKVTRDMDAYPEDTRDMLQKSMRRSSVLTAHDFLDVILFLHAVPQRATDRWDALDHEHDVTWFREHCTVYQNNEPLMAFLRDCAVVVLITGCFELTQEVTSIHACYVHLAAGIR